MAENSLSGGKVVPVSPFLLAELSRLVWGPNLKEEVFQRWAQGFVFSEDEPTALLQFEGGPCAVIVPVQAHLLKYAIFKHGDQWRVVPESRSFDFLVQALCEILERCSGDSYVLAMPRESGDRCPPLAENLSTVQCTSSDNEESNLTKSEEEYFRTSLKITKVSTIQEVESVYRKRIEALKDPFVVLSFLYSVLLTKGIDQIKNEMEDPNEPLIDGTYGHGSQSLINLMLTGHAVSNVWDNDKDISGLKLRGISKQSAVGFLTLLEHLRYCEVGWFLKCPEYPIWVIGSETHLTVLFSKERALVCPETPEAAARRIFKSYDPEGNNFISAVLLGDVLRSLELFCDPEYVDVMKQKLDPDGYGIILLNTFMDEFFPADAKSATPETFTLYHYNGLKRSCPNGKVQYQEGHACLPEDDIKCVPDATPILTCLQTKWSGIEVQWTSGTVPSII